MVEQESTTRGAGEKILLVEDDPAQLRILEQALASRDFHCVSFHSAEEALENVEASVLSAAIVDLHLPGMDGIEFSQELKKRVGNKRFLPVIVLSAKADLDDRVRGYKAGCDEVLEKPVHHFELVVRLDSLLARRKQRDELAQLNVDLMRAQERRSELASLIVHDLRNPLTALMGNVQLMQEFVDDPTMVAQCLKDMEELSEKTLSMVDGLLDVEELEEGRLVAERDELRVDEFCRRFPSFYTTTTKSRKLTMEVVVEDGLKARFDRALIGRIVENLLDNAVRYAPRKGHVELRARARDKDLVIDVGNTGPAIPEYEKSRIFERYYRLEGRRQGARTNRGLGLYFCRLAAEAHGGTIEVSGSEELPACFTLTLPDCVV